MEKTDILDKILVLLNKDTSLSCPSQSFFKSQIKQLM